jgi:hypothetical protein
MTGNSVIWRLAVKAHIFEVGFVVVLAAGTTLLAALVNQQLDAGGATPDCIARWLGGGGADAAGPCAAAVEAWAAVNSGMAAKVQVLMTVIPLVVGLLLGVPLIARDLEERTVSTAWAFAASRRRWLLHQLIPMVAIGVFLGGLLALASASLEDSRSVGGLWTSTFADASSFGSPVLAHALAALAVGLISGAVIGRTLPALIVAGVVVTVSLAVVGSAQSGWMPALVDAGTLDSQTTALDNPWIELRWFTSDQRLLTTPEALALAPVGTDSVQWIRDNLTPVSLGIPNAKTSEWQAFETAVYMAEFVAVTAATFIYIGRKRPA